MRLFVLLDILWFVFIIIIMMYLYLRRVVVGGLGQELTELGQQVLLVLEQTGDLRVHL